jgi:hypothetical protein
MDGGCGQQLFIAPAPDSSTVVRLSRRPTNGSGPQITTMRIEKKFQTNAEQCRQWLAAQRITLDQPGSILRDVQTLIEFIGADGLITSSNKGNLPNAALPAINARLTQPVELELNRALLKDYPNVAGLFILLRVMGLARADQKRVWIDQGTLGRWIGLNPTEQYFALLEAWLIQAQGEVAGGGQMRNFEQFRGNLIFLMYQMASHQWTNYEEYIHTYEFLGGVEAWNAQLQARFGLIEIRARPLAGRETKTRGWLLGAARRTAWGEAVAWAILEFLRQDKDFEKFYFFHLPKNAGFGFLRPAFSPYMVEWRNTFAASEPGVRPGTYIFKVSLGRGVWRRLAMDADCSLDGLACDILNSFDFDHDHLYDFQYRDLRGKRRVYNHSYCDEGPYTSEITVGESGLPEKEAMKFTFDYGDNWQFAVRLERIEPPGKLIKPGILDFGGQAPEQYPEMEE